MDYKAFDEVFNCIDKMTWWNCDVDNGKIVEIVLNNISEIVGDSTNNKTQIRIAGQSGSGKTTQLLPACLTMYKRLGIVPVHLCVRRFAKYHPDYENLLKKYKNEIREKTNGFALRCLVLSALLAMEMGKDILFEVTLLSPEFEDIILRCAKKYNYSTTFLCLAVSRSLSDEFIEKRKNTLGTNESGRVIYKSSSDFFYDTLLDALDYISKKCPDDRVIVWDAFKKQPIYDGKIKFALDKFIEGRNENNDFVYGEDELREAKTDYLIRNFILK